MFVHPTTIRLHDTDAAGRLYFAHQFRLAHEAYEAFLNQAGFPLARLLAAGRLGLPIVRAEADYQAPLAVGDTVAIEVKPTRIGARSFRLLFRLRRAGRMVGRVRTVHVAVNARGTPVALPAALRKALVKTSA